VLSVSSLNFAISLSRVESSEERHNRKKKTTARAKIVRYDLAPETDVRHGDVSRCQRKVAV